MSMTNPADCPLVDAHFHIYERSMPLAATAWHAPTADASIERCLATLDEHGITFGVVSAATIYGTYNDYVRRALRANPRLRGTAMVDLNWDMDQLERLKADGFVGMRLLFRPLAEIPDLGDEPYRRLLRRCADIGWHVHLTDRPERIGRTIASIEAAGAAVVLDHIGLIDTAEGVDDPGFGAILKAIERGRTWVKLSAAFRFKIPGLADRCAKALVGAGGWERLMWGSDWPFAGFEEQISYADTVAALRRWVPDPAMRFCIAGRTPLRLLFC
jgi:predicted TIM-barrel fold metal-dependent hydrolase